MTGATSWSGSCSRSRRHPRADRLSLTRVTVGSGEPLDIVCGATNIAAGQRVPVALPGAVLPGDRRIERTEKMGVVSNGMLCSGDELGLTGDADGILILPDDTPIGAALTELYGDVVFDVDVKPNRGDALSIVGLARELAAVTGGSVRMPPTEVTETGRPTAERLQVEVQDPDLCPRFVGRWVSDVRVAPSPDRGPDAAAGRRAAPDQQHRRCLELRDGRARQADPHLRRGVRPRWPDHRPPRDGRRAPRDARSRRARARPRDPAHRRRVRPDRHRRRHGQRRLGGRRRDDGRHRRVGHLRPGQHPADGLPLRAAVGCQPALREGPGMAARAARRRPDGSPHRGVGRRRGRPGCGRHRARTIRRRRTSHSGPPASTGSLGTTLGTDEQRDLLARVGIETAPAAPGTRITVAAGSKPLDVGGRRRRGRSTRPSRPGGATCWSRPTSPRRSPGSAATSSCPTTLPDTPMPPLPAGSAGRPDDAARDLAGAGLHRGRDLRARRAGGMVERFPARDDGAPDGEPSRRPGRSAHRRHQSAVQPALGPAPEPHRQPPRGRLDEPPPRPRRRRDLRGRQGLRRPRRAAYPRVVAARLRVDRRGRAAGPGPAGDRRTTSTTRRASSSCSAAVSVHRRRPSAPITDDPNLHPGRAARVVAGGDRRRPAGRAPSGWSSTRSTCAPSGSSSGSSRSPGWPAVSRRRTASARRPGSRPSSATSPSSSRSSARRPRSRRPSGAMAARCCAA